MSDLRKRAVTIADADGTAPDVSELIYDLLDANSTLTRRQLDAPLMQARRRFIGTREQLINALNAMPIRGGISGQVVAEAAAAEIVALGAPTDAEVLSAALGMFEVSNLIEAAVALHADMIAHADTSIGEDGIERGAIVGANQDVWQMFQSALAMVRP
jgi:hypothetical protein